MFIKDFCSQQMNVSLHRVTSCACGSTNHTGFAIFDFLIFMSFDNFDSTLHRVYGDKFTDDKDIDAFTKMQTDIVKKSVEELDESIVFDKVKLSKFYPINYLSFNFFSTT